MNCPVCKNTALDSVNLEDGLAALACPQCDGHWIQGKEYWKWLEGQEENLPERDGEGGGITVTETREIKSCPECRRFMVKYHVGRGVGFALDQCAACKGIWFDTHEWEVLKSRNLHDDINAILTAPWQAEALKEETGRRLERIYTSKFGAADYAEIKRVRAWLDAHPKKHELLAYLTDSNPLGV